jgi:hypothetical protein
MHSMLEDLTALHPVCPVHPVRLSPRLNLRSGSDFQTLPDEPWALSSLDQYSFLSSLLSPFDLPQSPHWTPLLPSALAPSLDPQNLQKSGPPDVAYCHIGSCQILWPLHSMFAPTSSSLLPSILRVPPPMSSAEPRPHPLNHPELPDNLWSPPHSRSRSTFSPGVSWCSVSSVGTYFSVACCIMCGTV